MYINSLLFHFALSLVSFANSLKVIEYKPPCCYFTESQVAYTRVKTSQHEQTKTELQHTIARAPVSQRVAEVCHFLLGLERSLPAGIRSVHSQLVEAVGLEYLSGGVGGGLDASRRAAVPCLPHEVNTAIDGTIRQHGASLLHGSGW